MGAVARILGSAILFAGLGGLGGLFFDALLRLPGEEAILYGAGGGAAFGLVCSLPAALVVSARSRKAREDEELRAAAKERRSERKLLTRDQAIADKGKSPEVAEENRKTVPIPLADETRKSDDPMTDTAAKKPAGRAGDEMPRIPLAGDEPAASPSSSKAEESGEAFSSYAEQLRCPYCKHKAVCDSWPEYGDLIPFYFQKAPGDHQLVIECSSCGNEWFVVWEENPHKAPF